MRQLLSSKSFLTGVLLITLLVTIWGRIQIGGWILVLGWWLLIIFPLIHLALHVLYLFKIERTKQDHLTAIYYSHLSYFLFFIMQYDMGDSPSHIALFDFIKLVIPTFGSWLYEIPFSNIKTLLLVLLINFFIAETIFLIKILN